MQKSANYLQFVSFSFWPKFLMAKEPGTIVESMQNANTKN